MEKKEENNPHVKKEACCDKRKPIKKKSEIGGLRGEPTLAASIGENGD